MSAPKITRLQSILARIKPFNELPRSHQTDIEGWKNLSDNPFERFDDIKRYCDQELVSCLVTLGVPQLEPYLAWIPFDYLESFHQLAEGGFAKVYSAQIYLASTQTYYYAAAKELKTSMVP